MNIQEHSLVKKAYQEVCAQIADTGDQRFVRIYQQSLAYLLFEGTPGQKADAGRILSHQLPENDEDERAKERFMIAAHFSIHQAVTHDQGDFAASDVRTFSAQKTTGELAAMGGSGPKSNNPKNTGQYLGAI